MTDSSSELSAQSWDGDQEVKGQQLNKMIGVRNTLELHHRLEMMLKICTAILRQRCTYRYLFEGHSP
jgi:hypothetical protein